ncbi:MAG TPA: tetratricopeptide repeat protein [Candidatus Krumholzibacteria bacterium]|nr:tetratricopeptide repeat protein [Candidatus Krumholzibacteria bacterium]HPD71535.1 tetratricopeptide repeat protein [Candidatus Krumholzibacteria bacterium]HRY41532.1 tetratricopeptide repeat protein [Candidatus Krumholzibacteria bacterium]
MAAQKFTKKELKKDSFVTWTERSLEFLQQNATVVGVAFLILVVLLVGGSYVMRGREAARTEASYLLFQGQTLLAQGDYELAMAPLQDCVDKHGGTEFGEFARVAVVQARLGLGEFDAALAAIDQYSAEIPADHAASGDLRLLRASVLADAGRFAEAADAMAGMITADLDDSIYYERSVLRSKWLLAAGQRDAALNLLEELRQAVASGELEVTGNDLENRLALARAIGR